MYLESNPYSTRSQMIMILLGAMSGLKGGHSKQEVISMIEGLKWFDFQTEDRLPYPSARTREPRWHTLIAFRRKDCCDEALFIQDGCRDSWQISNDGANAYAVRKAQFAAGQLDCSKCYIWSHVFKKHICPQYVPNNHDLERPYNVYKDLAVDKLIEKYRNII
jgi:hypothetical protein